MSNAPVVVLGAGPAGASAALWCASLGLPTVVLEGSPHLGGQLLAIPEPLENLPGLPGIRGVELAHTLARQLADHGVEVLTDHRATLDPAALRVRCDARHLTLDASAIVLATGASRRTLDIPGERALRSRGVEYNLGPDPSRHRGKRAVILGGGDDAFEHARLLAPFAKELTVVHRSDRYTAHPSLATPVRALANVTFRPFTVAVSVEGEGRVERITLRGPGGDETLPVDAVFVCIGPRPGAEGVDLALDPRGYVRVDRLQRTSRQGVWAVGDVCSPEAPTVATAFGQGATAAKVICAALAGHALEPWGPHVQAPPLSPAAPRAPRDTLTIEGLTLPARIGAYPRERRRTQTLTFRVSFEVDASEASPTDALALTVDYASVAAAIEDVLSGQHYNLIETVADRVAATLLARFPVPAITVRVTKPGVPLAGASASLEVRRVAARPGT